MTDLRNLSIPWISAVRGAAAGVGCSIALSADLIIANRSAYFLQAFRRIGLIPDGGSAFVISRGAGRVRAMEMMLLGDKLPATTALEWGLINRCVDEDRFDDEVETIAAKLASGPTHSLALTRKSAWAAIEGDYAASLALERQYQTEAGNTEDFIEGVKAFREKRPARFVGR
jgi:2-(1,2-epoxy-1,2-dihydrophenyl)acetyl-CoA isomerase